MPLWRLVTRSLKAHLSAGCSLDDRTGADLAPYGHGFRDQAPSWMSVALAAEPQLG